MVLVQLNSNLEKKHRLICVYIIYQDKLQMAKTKAKQPTTKPQAMLEDKERRGKVFAFSITDKWEISLQ